MTHSFPPRRSSDLKTITRRGLLKTGAATSIALAAPLHFVRGAWAKDYKPIDNFPARTEGSSVNYAFIVPLTGAYADEGADELRAYKLDVKHINEGSGMLETMKTLSLNGNGVLGRKAKYVRGDSPQKHDAPRTPPHRATARWGTQ